MWHDYFKTLYNSVPDNHDRDYVVNACSEADKDVFECISISDVMNALLRSTCKVLYVLLFCRPMLVLP